MEILFTSNSAKDQPWEYRSGAHLQLISASSPAYNLPSTSTVTSFIFSLYYPRGCISLLANDHPTRNKSILYKLPDRPSSSNSSTCHEYLGAHKSLVRFTGQTPSCTFYTWEIGGSVHFPGQIGSGSLELKACNFLVWAFFKKNMFIFYLAKRWRRRKGRRVPIR